MSKIVFQIRDPIHGVINISPQEREVVESRELLRLRNIKQVGFLDFAFPSATHSRFAHSLGAMAMASKIAQRVFDELSLTASQRNAMEQTLRLAALLHDIGHAPLSHTTEKYMPMLSALRPHILSDRQANHEDYTQEIIENSPLSRIIVDKVGVDPSIVASLLRSASHDALFVVDGVDFTPLMRQIISSEIDADRMDYLLRDSFFCGVNYGKFDAEWLIESLTSVEHHGKRYLALKERGIFAFEDFLLSRYHMFASVYLHHTPIIMEKMLSRFFASSASFSLPTDIHAYLELDDTDLWLSLKQSDNEWAQRIVQRRPYTRIFESYGGFGNCEKAIGDAILEQLQQAQIDVITTRSRTVLSKYSGEECQPLFVKCMNQAVLLEDFSPLFKRYQTPVELFRIYVDPAIEEAARLIIERPKS